MMEVCGDGRFEIIEKAKQAIIESTNIETSQEEMAVLDNILFRCWQMGWLDKYGNRPSTDGDLISRRALMKRISEEYHKYGDDYDALQILGNIEDFPSAESTGAMDEAIQKYIKDGYMQPIGEDLISRQDTIQALKRAFSDGDGVELGAYWHHGTVIKVLNSLPSAETSTVSEKHQLSAETSTNTSTNTSTDLISRQDAIDTVFSHRYEYENKLLNDYEQGWNDACDYAADEWLESLQSAEPREYGVLCALADRECPFQGKEFAWCLTCPHISEEDRELVKKAIAEPKTGERRTCKRNADNGGVYEDGRTKCPIQEHYALLLDGYCHLYEQI